MQNDNSPLVQAQIVYFSHGGGPLPLLGDASHEAMVDFMTELPGRLRKPDAIVVISAHWEESAATLLSGNVPPIFYDYSGFPETAYSIQYPAPGSPELAGRISKILSKENLASRLNPKRGYDHGLFIPLKLMYPNADIPCLQLSLVRGLNPAVHLAIGKALRELMQENILLVGSGFSFHNMRAFSWDSSRNPDPANDAFQNWLIDVCTSPITEAERGQCLIRWEKAPFARYCHPREEHLLPLHVCAGMGQKPAELIFDDYILGKRSVAFLW
jgi:aromatic ring-opening dioxygenase catalytic subunit (LigB family)